MNFNIGDLIRDTLREQGCDETLINDFDGHSTISLDFSTIPSILISEVDDSIFMWTRLAEHRPNILQQCSASILEMLMEPTAYSITGNFHLCEDDGFTVLKMVVKPSLMNTTDLSDTLEEFYRKTESFMEVLR